jgi:hypothetical protein
MRTLGFCLSLLCFAGCATVSAPPLTAADVVVLAKDGRSSKEIIAELQRTNTVIPLKASDYVALHTEGVPDDVLNYLQLVQIEDARWRERSLYYWNGPGWGYYNWGPCRYRGRWGC